MKPSDAIEEGRKRIPTISRGVLMKIDREGRVTEACHLGAAAVGRGVVAMVPDASGELLVAPSVAQWWRSRLWWWGWANPPAVAPCSCGYQGMALDVVVAHLSDRHPELDPVPWLRSVGQ